MPASESDAQGRTMTIEAFADTLVPGEKRWPQDVAVAGATTGGGAVAAGAIELVSMPATGVSDAAHDLADVLNKHADVYASEHGLPSDAAVPPFVALPYRHRRALVGQLTAPGHPEKELWVLLALFCFMAFDTAAHMHTAEAVAAGHPGLATMGFASPDADGLWRFTEYSYGRPLARVHPGTTASGSPA
ncbi:MAG TPA: DUF5987 family protein [Streptosporangiaceae bacterium]|nr:DUF5987 family protein [Streptosporangiaceae bacterium]